MESSNVEKFLEGCRRIADAIKKVDYTDNKEAALELPAGTTREWAPDEKYKHGELCHKDGVKYLIVASGEVTAQEHQPPDMPNGAMLAVYKPFQDEGRCPWVYGEYCEIGFERQDPDDGKWYTARQDPGANIYPPSQVPAVWVLSENQGTDEDEPEVPTDPTDEPDEPDTPEYRIIPETITAEEAFEKGERGIWQGDLYESTFDGKNVWTPKQYPAGWRKIEE